MKRIIDLTGKTFGRLTVLSRAEATVPGKTMWVCQCSCPNHTIVTASTSSLRGGNKKSCGCLAKEPHSHTTFIDLTGKRFGRLVVVKRVGNAPPSPSMKSKVGPIQYLCKCDCGNTTIATGGNLRSGCKRSCGCLHREMTSKCRLKDLTGKRFGRLVVLNLLPERGKLREVKYRCKCDCGRIHVTTAGRLSSGITQSCGCYHLERIKEARTKWTPEEAKIVAHLYEIKKRCYNKNYKDFEDWGGRGITVCDEWMDPISGYRKFVDWAKNNGYKKGLSIDRIDNDGPYAPWNCRWVDWYTQANNKRNNVFVDINGVRHTIAEWSRECGLDYDTLYHKFEKGYDLFRDTVLYNLSLRK